MRECEIDGHPIPLNSIGTHWTIWEKVVKKYSLQYCIKLSFDEVVSEFDSYWEDVIELESNDIEDESNLDEVDIKLKKVNFPTLIEMLETHSALFCSYIMTYLKSEFTGYIAGDIDSNATGDVFSIRSLDHLEIKDGILIAKGRALNESIVI